MAAQQAAASGVCCGRTGACQAGFRVVHRARHRRLLHAQTLGCTGQMQFFRNCDEVTQQSEIQVRIPDQRDRSFHRKVTGDSV
jgi:hypothetical protein